MVFDFLFLTKITFQKRVFVFDDIFHPVWWEKVKSKTKTRFCFSFLSDRLYLDRPYRTRKKTQNDGKSLSGDLDKDTRVEDINEKL